MLVLNQNSTNETVIVTLTELTTLPAPKYLFVFKQQTTKQVVTIIFAAGADESDYPERYNQFSINTAALFAGQQLGEYHYTVYEQESDTNTDPAGLNAVEYGKMYLRGMQQATYTQQSTVTTYKVYNG